MSTNPSHFEPAEDSVALYPWPCSSHIRGVSHCHCVHAWSTLALSFLLFQLKWKHMGVCLKFGGLPPTSHMLQHISMGKLVINNYDHPHIFWVGCLFSMIFRFPSDFHRFCLKQLEKKPGLHHHEPGLRGALRAPGQLEGPLPARGDDGAGPGHDHGSSAEKTPDFWGHGTVPQLAEKGGFKKVL